MWTRGPRLVERTVLGIATLALTVELVRVLADGNTVGGWTSLLMSSVGVAVIARNPVLSLVCVSVGPIAGALLGWDTITTWTVACFASLVLALRGLPAVVTGVVVSISVFAASGLTHGSISVHENPTASIAGFAAVVFTTAGSSIRAHRKYWFELERRHHDAVATREAAVNRAIAEERVQIARDLHDSVGHHIAVVSMHLGSAEVHLPPDAKSARADLERARTEVQAVLRETQMILQVLRVDGESGSTTAVASHEQIPDLIAAFRDAGMDIDAVLPDIRRDIAPGPSAAAFRITQEALTNAQRHGSGAVTLTMTAPEGEDLVIEIVNACGRGGTTTVSGGGRGLIGMSERATSLGGTLEANDHGGWFRVEARLPVNGRTTR